MKVDLTDNTRRFLTPADIAAAEMMTSGFDNDGTTAADYLAKVAAFIVPGDCTISSASAELVCNWRVYDYYSNDSGRLDVQITGCACCSNGDTYRIIAYLSDINCIGAAGITDCIRRNMAVKKII